MDYFKRYPVLFMILSGAVGGGASALLKGASETIPIFTAGGLRYLVLGLAFVALFSKWKVRSWPKFNRAIAINCLLMIMTVFFWLAALERIQAINVTIGFLLSPVFLYMGSVLFLKEPAALRPLAGSLIALVGASLLLVEPILSDDVGVSTEVLGNAFVLLASVLFAGVVLHAKIVYRYADYKALLGVRSVVVGVAMLGYAAVRGELDDLTSASLESWLYLIGNIVFSGLIGNWFFYASLRWMRAEDGAPLIYVDSLSGVIFAAVLLGERFSAFGLVAAAIIVMGILVAHPVHVYHYFFYRNPHFSKFERLKHWLKDEEQAISKKLKSWI